MSFGVQSQTVTLAEMSLFAAEADDAEQQQQVDSSLPDAKGGLKTNSKNYTFTPRPQNTPHAQKTREYVHTFGPKTSTKADAMAKSSPMNLARSTYRLNSFSQPQKPAEAKPNSSQPQQKSAENKTQTTATAKSTQTPTKAEGKPTQAAPRGAQPTLAKTHAETTRGLDKALTRHEKRDVRQESKHSTPLQSRQWSKQETKQWWDSRYTHKERQGEELGLASAGF